ncbi:MAG: T9SS type A sorting domain-containing protein [Candidatus Zixiibacteriota bacterium]
MNVYKVIITGISAIFFFCICVNLIAAISAPVCPTVFAGSDGKYEIYWFYPGLHETSAGELSKYPDDVGAPSVVGGQYAIMTRFGLEPPAVVNGAALYIANFDPFPNQPGDQFTPLKLFLGRSFDNGCFAYERTYVLALDSSACGLGEIVGIDDIGFSSILHNIWIGLEWPGEESISPFIGASYNPVGLEQYILETGETSCFIREAQKNYMLEIGLLNWTAGNNPEGISESVPEGLLFEVLFAEDTLNNPGQYEVLDVVGPDSLFAAVNIAAEGFICIRASNGIDTARSVWTGLDSRHLPDIAVYPPVLEMPRNKMTADFYDFALANTGPNSLSVQLDYDSLLMRPSSRILSIEPGETAVVGLELLAGSDEDSLLNSTITILSSEDKYPILYHVKFLSPEPTGIEEAGQGLPIAFSISEAFPNPFNGSVSYKVASFSESRLNLEVFDILGRLVCQEEMVVNDGLLFTWTGQDDAGRDLASGVYIFRFSNGPESIIRRAILIK